MKQRLDKEIMRRGLVNSRSQAESYIRLGDVKVNGRVATKAGVMTGPGDIIELTTAAQYVSRAGLKLASVAQILGAKFSNATVLDVGSSTGGFTDYALQHGAHRVIAVDVGTDQLHPKLQGHPRIELHEKTDIRDYAKTWQAMELDARPLFDIVVLDVSFISLTEILPCVAQMSTPRTQILAMVKPQFEAGREQINKGVIKNDTVRRTVLKEFETWTQKLFRIEDKADSEVSGTKGNRERFYSLRVLQKRS